MNRLFQMLYLNHFKAATKTCPLAMFENLHGYKVFLPTFFPFTALLLTPAFLPKVPFSLSFPIFCPSHPLGLFSCHPHLSPPTHQLFPSLNTSHSSILECQYTTQCTSIVYYTPVAHCQYVSLFNDVK